MEVTEIYLMFISVVYLTPHQVINGYTPFLKKKGLDCSVYDNYLPISNLHSVDHTAPTSNDIFSFFSFCFVFEFQCLFYSGSAPKVLLVHTTLYKLSFIIIILT